MNAITPRGRDPVDTAVPVLVGALGLLVAGGVATGRLGDGRFAWPWFPLAHLVFAPVAAALAYRLARPAADLRVVVGLALWGAVSTAISFSVTAVLASVVPWNPWVPSPLAVLDVALFLGWMLSLVAVSLVSARLAWPRSALALAAAPLVQAAVTFGLVALL